VFELSALAKKWMCEPHELPRVNTRTTSGLVWHTRLDEAATTKIEEWITAAKNEPAEWSFQAISSALKIKLEHMRAYLENFVGGGRFKDVLTLTSSSLRYDPRRGELSGPERRAAEDLLGKLQSAGPQPFRLVEYSAASGVDKKTFDKAAARLLKDGQLIRIDNDFVLERGAWNSLTERVRRTAAESFTASEFGKYLGLSRKYSVPYLECLNRAGILRRRGDRHVVVR
jgi:hypothetical protein